MNHQTRREALRLTSRRSQQKDALWYAKRCIELANESIDDEQQRKLFDAAAAWLGLAGTLGIRDSADLIPRLDRIPAGLP